MDLLTGFSDLCELLAAAFLLTTGIFFNIKTRFFPIRRFPSVLKNTLFRKREADGDGELTSFQAFSYALAGTLGIGNLVGVALAIRHGGAGALFWIWISAALSAVIKCAEIYLCKKYPGVGPFGYLKQAFRRPLPHTLYTVALLGIALFMGNMVQSNAVTSSLPSAVPTPVSASLTALLCGLFLLISPKKRAKLIAGTTPLMTGLYLFLGLLVILRNAAELPAVLSAVFRDAFSIKGLEGGVLSCLFLSALRYGSMNGVFSHEAGLGSSPFAHAQTNTDAEAESHWGVVEVFFDSIAVSTVTGLLLLTSGSDSVSLAFSRTYGGAGTVFSVILTTLFAVSSMVTWCQFGLRMIPSTRTARQAYTVLFLTLAYVGGVLKTDLVWQLSSLLNALALFINLTALWRLRKDYTDLFRSEQPSRRTRISHPKKPKKHRHLFS